MAIVRELVSSVYSIRSVQFRQWVLPDIAARVVTVVLEKTQIPPDGSGSDNIEDVVFSLYSIRSWYAQGKSISSSQIVMFSEILGS